MVRGTEKQLNDFKRRYLEKSKTENAFEYLISIKDIKNIIF